MSGNVWDNIYTKGNQYCTKKSLGEICADKRDVVLKKEVPAGSDSSDYGDGSTAGLQSQSDNMWSAGYDEKAVNDKKSKEAAEDRQKAKVRARSVNAIGEDKVSQRERAGNSIEVKP